MIFLEIKIFSFFFSNYTRYEKILHSIVVPFEISTKSSLTTLRYFAKKNFFFIQKHNNFWEFFKNSIFYAKNPYTCVYFKKLKKKLEQRIRETTFLCTSFSYLAHFLRNWEFFIFRKIAAILSIFLINYFNKGQTVGFKLLFQEFPENFKLLFSNICIFKKIRFEIMSYRFKKTMYIVFYNGLKICTTKLSFKYFLKMGQWKPMEARFEFSAWKYYENDVVDSTDT